MPTGLGVGEECSEDSCRAGLSCVDGACAPGGESPAGSSCVIAPECEDDLQCVFGTCVPGGSGEEGDSCQTDANCGSGLRCSLHGLATECAPAGTVDFGQPCAGHDACYAGLYCVDGACALPEPPFGIPLWKGTDCAARPDSGTVKAYFEVPGAAGADEGDFFRLPFPNDVRLADGTVDLGGFPTPGPDLLGVDVVQAYVEKLDAEASGWSANAAILFRFSGGIDFDSIRFDDGKRPVVIADLDAETKGTAYIGAGWKGSASRTNYVCHDWLAVRAGGQDYPLIPGHRYAVWITTDALAADGSPIERSANFEALLADTAPTDVALAAAHTAYQPLRDYLAELTIDPDTLLNATVFTVEDSVAPMRALASAVATEDAPTASDWVKCSASAESPCPQAEGVRSCGEGTADYDEYHALVSLPVFQQGEAPYLTSGGAIAASAVRTEDVCLSLTVPKDTMPGQGWPLVIYAHGTGGSFRSHVRDEVAGVLARATPKFAVLGIDQVQHGPRRGDSTEDPDDLFFNFLNPDAARGNPLQGAADQLALHRFASALDVTVGADEVRVDPTRIVFFGHSQGSTHGSLMLPVSGFPGAVLSGNGGGLIDSLLGKTNPVNIAGAIPFAIQDVDPFSGQLAMGSSHPVLTLLQHWVDPADPINLAPVTTIRPEAGGPKHVLQTFGLGDTYSPPKTLMNYAFAAELDLAAHPAGVDPMGDDLIPGMTPASGPLSLNAGDGQTSVTGVVRQYAPPTDRDGHFVVFEVPEANQDAVNFLEALATGTAPVVP